MEIVGTWTSEVRETKQGPMLFEFRIGSDGKMDVTGTPAKGSEAEVFRRSGSYRLDGEQLVSLAVNEGRPVQVRLQAGILYLTIDKTLVFRLRRI
jgi:hypothetical protein